MEWQYKLEGQSGRRRGIAGVPGELSETTAQRGGLMDESAGYWSSLASLLSRGCCLLFIEDSALPVPRAVISCTITEAPWELRDSMDQRLLKVLDSVCIYIDWPFSFTPTRLVFIVFFHIIFSIYYINGLLFYWFMSIQYNNIKKLNCSTYTFLILKN